jgi:flagella basal body P-ring formation protein FlgA
MMMRSLILATGLGLLLAGTALAAPVLRAEVAVTASVVTLGDMFTDAGAGADTPLFRAPAPGTAGSVPVTDIAAAARAAGIAQFDTAGLASVRVVRTGSPVDTALAAGLIESELLRRGLRPQGVLVRIGFDTEPRSIAAAVPDPVRIAEFAFNAETGRFTATLSLAGQPHPLTLTGRADMLVEVPHLVTAKPAGTLLSSADIELRPVPYRQAEAASPTDLSLLIGRQLRRTGREGLVLRAADVIEPVVVDRNGEVTVLLSYGAMTLTMRGKALNAAAAGEMVQVLNTATRKILHGVALADGSVALTLSTPSQPSSAQAPAKLAGL